MKSKLINQVDEPMATLSEVGGGIVMEREKSMMERSMNRMLRVALVAVLAMVFGMAGFVASVEAAISYVNGTTQGFTTANATYNVSLAGLGIVEGDLVIVATGFTGTADGNPGVTTAGYTEIFDLYAAGTSRASNFSANYKIMGATPDTQVTVNAANSTANASVTVVQVWRGVDPTNPMDVAATTAIFSGANAPDSPSITPVTAGAYVLTLGSGSRNTTVVTMTAPAGYSNADWVAAQGSTLSFHVGVASIAWAGGAVDPGAWGTSSTFTSDSWAAGTIALRPEPACTPGTLTAPTGDVVSGNPLDICGAIATTGGTSVSNVYIYEGASGSPTTLQLDDWETGYADLAQVFTPNWADDGSCWYTNTGAQTPSAANGSDTGPPISGRYIYLEGSGATTTPGCGLADGTYYFEQTSTLDAGVYALTFNFDYASTGADGTTPRVMYLDVWNGTSWDSQKVTISTGPTTGTQSASIDLDALGYNTGQVKVRFQYNTGAGGNFYSKDYAIDNMEFIGTPRSTPLYNGASCSGIDTTGWTSGVKNVDVTADDGCSGTLNDTGTIDYSACTDGDLATLTTTNPGTASGVVTIQTAVGFEASPATMQNMSITIAGSSACNVSGAAMSWNAGSSRWEYSWDTSACGTGAVENGITIDVSGNDPDCANPLINAAQVTGVSIDNTCTESGTVTLGALPNPITGAIAVTATAGGGATTPEVSFDGGVTWQASGATYTPPSQANMTVNFAVRALGSCGVDTVYDNLGSTTLVTTPVNVDARTLSLEPNSATAVQSSPNSIRVTFDYCGDQDGDATYKADYKLASSGTWTNGTASIDSNNDGIFTVNITGLTLGETYDIRMTFADPDGVSEVNVTAVSTTSVTLIPWSDSNLLHNSNRFTGTSKHGGNWGTPGTYAGGITCATCHAKNSGNAKRIQSSISFPDGTTMPNGATSSAVSMQTVVDGSSDFGDDSAAPRASSNKVCEVCHTYDATQANGVKQHAADQQVAASHFDNADCTKCHQHKVGFKADCTACHGNPPTVNTAGGPNGLDNSAGTGSATAGKHDKHVNTLMYTCDTCHDGWMANGQMPNGGDLNIGFNIVLGSTTDTTGAYDGRSAGTYSAAAGTTVTGGSALTCSAIYCHGTSTPVWLDTEPAMACGSCHGNATNGAPIETAGDGDLSGAITGKKVGKHVKHIAKYNCATCHNGAGFGSALHVNGTNDIIFNTALAGASATYTKASSTCSNLACHGDQVWDTASAPLSCDSCHGYPPTSTGTNNKHVAGSTPVYHDKALDGVTTTLTNNHSECNTCHGKSLTNGETDNTAAGGDAYQSSYHMDGNIEMNGWATDSGQDTQYDQTTTFGCAKACHANNIAHQLSDSGLTVQLHRYGAGDCNGCHNTGTGGAPIITASSSHVDADGAGASYVAGTCTDCHPGGTKGAMHAKNGDANVAVIANNLTVGVDYAHTVDTGINGFVLGGDATTGTSEAQICWNCHDSNGVSEWGTNTQSATGSSPYNYGNLSGGSNWTTATWSSSRTQYAYKTGAIQSTHSANPTPSYPLGTLTGAAYNRTESPDDVRDIRCSYCHDVHELGLAPGDTKAGKPYLRGNWMGNPYEEDGAPRGTAPPVTGTGGTGYASTTYFTSYNFTTDTGGTAVTRTYGWGRVPRGSTQQAMLGGYWIDQNNVTPMSAGAGSNGTSARNPTASWTTDQFAGLCALCHGGGDASWTATEIDNIDQVVSEGLWVGGGNGHANSVKGGTGSSSANSANIFTARNGTTTGSQYNPRQHWNGISDPGDSGSGWRASSAQYAYQPTFSSGRAYGWRHDDWKVDETGATKENQYHKFSCSKCHNPHASRLPKLMITNCLDTVHNTWDNQFQMSAVGTQNTNRELAQWTSAQNCHRYSESNNTTTTSPEYRASRQASPAGAGAGWNNATPWKQTGTQQ